MNEIKITLQLHNEERDIFCKKGMSLYYAIMKAGIPVNACCAGKGICGGCKIRLLEGELEITEWDEHFFSQKELQEGYRLACKAFPEDDCIITMETEKQMQILSHQEETVNEIKQNVNEPLAIAIDLGTTTIVYQLISAATGAVYNTVSTQNCLRVYGADVMSRMEASVSGKREEISAVLKKQLGQDVQELLRDYQTVEVSKIGLCANTAMIHLLMGYSCEKLCKYPFEPVTLETIKCNCSELGIYIKNRNAMVEIMPGISGYVGGDILVGIAWLGLLQEKEPVILLDLGTNGEMALYDGKGSLFVTSVPAGPAFEGGNISCGMGSVKGAICTLNITDKEICYQTIMDGEPKGICGSGVIELVYELRKAGLADDTGLLCDEIFEKGFELVKKGNEHIFFWQKDMREVQMAKAAVAAAFDILIQKAGLQTGDLQKVYLAGGFGYYLNIEKASKIGMFSAVSKEYVKTVGNTALAGLKACLTGKISANTLSAIKNCTTEVYLSNEKEFEALYLSHMGL